MHVVCSHVHFVQSATAGQLIDGQTSDFSFSLTAEHEQLRIPGRRRRARCGGCWWAVRSFRGTWWRCGSTFCWAPGTFGKPFCCRCSRKPCLHSCMPSRSQLHRWRSAGWQALHTSCPPISQRMLQSICIVRFPHPCTVQALHTCLLQRQMFS